MPLLGAPLLVVLAVLTAGLPVLALWLWRRVRGPRLLVHATRLGLVVLSQLAAVLLTGAALNNYGYFYSSWGELFGTSGTGGSVSEAHYGATDPGALDAVADPGLPRGTKAEIGSLIPMTVAGGPTHLSEPVLVYLPPAYYQGVRRLPLVEVFTGYPGSELNLVRRLQYPRLLLQEINANNAANMVLVLLRPTVTPPRDTECTDVPAGPQALSFFARDVPAAVARITGITPPTYGAIGDSTGGYCATKLALLDPHRFIAAASLSGYFNAIQDSTTGDLWGGSRARREHNDLSWRLQHLPQPPVSLILGTSRTEHGPDGYGASMSFLRLVRPPLSADVVVEPRGGHNFNTWIRELPGILDWMSTKLMR